MIVTIAIIVAIILVTAVLAAIYINTRNKPEEETVSLVFSNVSNTKVVRSRYFPDDWYVGKTLTLDKTLKYVTPNAFFVFPTSPLVISSISHYAIGENEIEELQFEPVNNTRYAVVHDALEKSTYFLNLVHVESVGETTPTFVTNDTIELIEADNEYEYDDFTGLLEVNVVASNQVRHGRLMRVFSRELTQADDEYLFTQLDGSRVEYWLGVAIHISQLEDN